MSQSHCPQSWCRAANWLTAWLMVGCSITGCVPHAEPVAAATDAATAPEPGQGMSVADAGRRAASDSDVPGVAGGGSWAPPSCSSDAEAALDIVLKGTPFGADDKGRGFAVEKMLDPLDFDCAGEKLATCRSDSWSSWHENDWSYWGDNQAESSAWNLEVGRGDGSYVELERGAPLWVIPIRHGVSGGIWSMMYLSVEDPDLQEASKELLLLRVDVRAAARCAGPNDDGEIVPIIALAGGAGPAFLKFGGGYHSFDFFPPPLLPDGFQFMAAAPMFFRQQFFNRIVDMRFRFSSKDGKVWGEHIGKALLAWDDELP